nr:zinc finger, CCHC-type [Tanacetum cinerariifolium]
SCCRCILPIAIKGSAARNESNSQDYEKKSLRSSFGCFASFSSHNKLRKVSISSLCRHSLYQGCLPPWELEVDSQRLWVDFGRWQKKMHFLLSTMSVMYVLNTPIYDYGDDAKVEQIRRMNKWDNDDYKYFKHTLKHKKEELTLVELGNHMRIEESLRVQDSDKPKSNNVVGPSVVNMVEHNNSIMYNDNKGKRKHQDTKTDPNKSHMRIEESLRVQDSDKPKSNNVAGPSVVNMAEHNNSIMYNDNKGKRKHQDTKTDPNKRAVIEILDLKLQTLDERGIECTFVGYAEHSKTFRLYVIEPNELVSINSIIKSRDVIFDENRFSLVPRPSQRSLKNETKDIGGLVVPEEVVMDVKTTFLNGELDEEVYMNQPQGFIMPCNEDTVFKLIKSLYGLKLAPKQCSTMESKFIALAAVGKEAEWLKNLILEIPLCFKPITPISIRCDSVVTLAKAYSQMYNGKSRHLGVRSLNKEKPPISMLRFCRFKEFWTFGSYNIYKLDMDIWLI